jgi:DNA-directed RNA polymerase specialized sigma24 family protein
MSPDGDGSVTNWLAELKQGNPGAVQPLWERYFEALVRLAGKKLCASRRPLVDEDGEDVALSAFHDFCAAAQRGQFPQLDSRDDLWRILVHLTACKAIDQMKRRAAQRRGGGRTVLEADLRPVDDGDEAWGLDQIIAQEPSPEFAVELAEECQRRIEGLKDLSLRRIALMKLACHTHEEIRAALGCSLRSVTLKVELIRKRWQAEPSS